MSIIEIEHSYGDGASDEYVAFVENNLSVKFPESFINITKLGDQIVPLNKEFTFKNKYNNLLIEAEIGSFLSFDSKNKYNILRRYFLMPSFFPRTLIPFAEVGNGDLICFDYSIDGFEDKNPPVVYWIHDNPEGYEIADVAINFDEFLKKLKSSSEE
jgi:hypothetical protein